MRETVGFIGTGRIAGAVIEGLLRAADPPPAIVVSPRNAARAAALSAAHPSVSVAGDNQAVVYRSRTVFLCVRPQVAIDIIAPLRFTPDQTIVSLIPLPAEVVRPRVAPAVRFVRALPLPACAAGLGAVPYWPADAGVHDLLSALGWPLPLSNEHDIAVLWAVTALISPFYALMETTRAWAVENGTAPSTATDYVAAMFHAVAADALDGPEDRFSRLAVEAATPGGLNEQALGMIRAGGAYDHVRGALDAILRRIAET
jgi:pyrroline-5-carboxylate reductase